MIISSIKVLRSVFMSDKFAGKACKFVEIDSQELAESSAEETLRCYEIVLDQKTSKLPCLRLA